ncbi:MAG TPA: glycogen debranching N-terminal domain-containing protein [Nitrospira sp.]|nr:glycogen debranching N-terminal domain-containing protein [Nitrospira sp.]
MLNRRTFLRCSLSWPLSAPLLNPHPVFAKETPQARRDDTLTKGRPTDVESLAHAIVMKKDNVFFVAQPDGNVPMRGNHGMGLYYHDCRYLNGYELTLAGQAAAPLSASAAQGSMGVFTLTNPEIRLPDGGKIDKEQVGLTWHRLLDSKTPALLDEVRLENFTLDPARFSVAFAFRSSFEDLYVVRGLAARTRGQLDGPSWRDGVLQMQYRGADGVTRALFIRTDPAPDDYHDAAFTFHVALAPRGRWSVRLSLTIEETASAAALRRPSRPADIGRLESALIEQGRDFSEQITQVSGNGSALDQLMDRAFRSLRVLRAYLGHDAYFAAGVPWFVTLFGRDSVITAMQILGYHPGIAEQTLRLLVQYQGTRDDPWRDEEPGKILHELRVGELANLNAIPQTPFYGTVDATPLFLMLVARHAAWTGSLRLFHDLRSSIDRALEWLDRASGRHPAGYLAYESRAGHDPKTMVNKGWKDSGNAIVNEDGSLAESPIALSEVQGYVYAARREMADLFERAGEPERADRLRRQAAGLRDRFNRDFWMKDQSCFALALQKDGRPAAVVTSNAGQVLWSGIAEDDKAQQTIDRMMADDMFSGWGVRTLSAKARAFNPIGYHLGTVWPHDNSMIAAGFRRYGRDQEALRIFHGLFDAAFHFHAHQLPELFCGYSREAYEIPVNYPVACHPQAWAAGALPYLLMTLLGLEPDGFAKRLKIVRPMLPGGLDRLAVTKLRVGEASVDLAFRRNGTDVEADIASMSGGLEVVIHKGGA